MARTKHKSRKIPLDPKYPDVMVTRLVNYVMKEGKKALARRIVYDSFEIIQKETEEDPLAVFLKAMQEIMPQVEVRSRRVGGANLQIPINVRPVRQKTLALRWLSGVARTSKGKKTIAESLAGEIIAASKGEGGAIKRKTTLYKSAQSHKAYSHLK